MKKLDISVEGIAKQNFKYLDSVSMRDAQNAEYDHTNDGRIIMYSLLVDTSEDEIWATISLAKNPPESGEDEENGVGTYYCVMTDDTKTINIYTYKGEQINTAFKSWGEGYKYISEILKVIGLKGKPQILNPVAGTSSGDDIPEEHFVMLYETQAGATFAPNEKRVNSPELFWWNEVWEGGFILYQRRPISEEEMHNEIKRWIKDQKLPELSLDEIPEADFTTPQKLQRDWFVHTLEKVVEMEQAMTSGEVTTTEPAPKLSSEHFFQKMNEHTEKHNPVDSQKFFDLMQNYRLAPQENQERVVMRFEAVKDFIKAIKAPEAPLLPEALNIDSWHETHYEVVVGMNRQQSDVVDRVQAKSGHGGLYELAKELTDKFEKEHEGREWDGEFYDTIEAFLDREL